MPIEIHADLRTPSGASALGMPIYWLRRPATPRIAGDIAGTSLSQLTLTALQMYAIPFVVPREVALTGLRLSVTTAAAGTASLGVYANALISGAEQPGALLAQASGLDLGTTGEKNGSFGAQLILRPGDIYWAALVGSAAATLRALTAASIHTGLGRSVGANTAITHLTATLAGATLPSTAPTSMATATGAAPAIYLLEA